MKAPKFLMGDNTQSGETLYIIHTESPAFILDVDTEEVQFLEEGFGEEDESGTATEISELITQAMDFYDSEIEEYEKIEE